MRPHDATQLIELKLQTMQQLFESMDPSPFHERDLDADAEDFIVGWAQEYHVLTRLKLVVHLDQRPACEDAGGIIAESVHHYFGYKAELNRRAFRLLMRDGWTSLLIGLCFLAACSTAAHALAPRSDGWTVLREGLTIIGWVAMWSPLDIYLYRWWPVRRAGNIYRKLSEIPVEVVLPE